MAKESYLASEADTYLGIYNCDMEERFDYLPEIADSEWTELSIRDQILTDGFTLKQAYCPGHSLEENKTNASAVSGKEAEAFVSEMNEGLGMPLTSSDTQQHPYHNNPQYARFDFAEDGVVIEGMLVACGADSCYNEAETADVDQLENEGWVGGNWVGLLANGLILFEGRCPEHSQL